MVSNPGGFRPDSRVVRSSFSGLFTRLIRDLKIKMTSIRKYFLLDLLSER